MTVTVVDIYNVRRGREYRTVNYICSDNNMIGANGRTTIYSRRDEFRRNSRAVFPGIVSRQVVLKIAGLVRPNNSSATRRGAERGGSATRYTDPYFGGPNSRGPS